MILKFWNRGTKSWVYEDAIARVSIRAHGEILLRRGDGPNGPNEPPMIVNAKGLSVERPDWIVGDLVEWLKELANKGSTRYQVLGPNGILENALGLKLLYLLYKNGRDKTLLFRGDVEDRVFLMNDEGKTIERL